MSFSQKEAVFNAITSVFEDNSIDFEPGEKIDLTKELRASVTEIVAAGVEAGDVAFSDAARTKYTTPEKIRGYVSNMVGNWLTKDTRLNGGDKYQPKNPGSRAGQGDAELRELKKLLKQVTLSGNEEHIAQVNIAITGRQKDLEIAKGKSVEINEEHIPEALRGLIPSLDGEQTA